MHDALSSQGEALLPGNPSAVETNILSGIAAMVLEETTASSLARRAQKPLATMNNQGDSE